MPCEGCHVQFTVFRRKRCCSDCRRYYCNNCLSTAAKNISQVFLCERCAVFAKRPLLKADLLQLKPKDLIFYLQSKHISTAGCVEKDELIMLILNHVQDSAATRTIPNESCPSGSSRSNSYSSNSFSSLKQSCQNFLVNISETLSDSLSSFEDGKRTFKPQQQNESAGFDHSHIFDQPRVSAREIPSYASAQAGYLQIHRPTINDHSNVHRLSVPDLQSDANIIVNINTDSSPIVAALGCINSKDVQEGVKLSKNSENCDVMQETKSECDCSDDEVIAAIRLLSAKREKHGQTSKHEEEMRAASTHITSTVTGQNNLVSFSFKGELCDDDVSSQSSFEELGAIGGISDDSKTATDTNSSNLDQWQILDGQRVEMSNIPEKHLRTTIVTGVKKSEILDIQHIISTTDQTTVSNRMKKVTRRRSDGYLNRRQLHSDDDESPPGTRFDTRQQVMLENDGNLKEDMSERIDLEESRCVNCKLCGKNKANIIHHVEKMRRHLESAQLSESDIKSELNDFITYLEKRTLSLDRSDSEAAGSSFNGTISLTCQQESLGETDGIHVYASSSSSSCNAKDMRFICLGDFNSVQELESLTVKQLKEVLMLNRIDYKGCCEKQELYDRVERLWKNLKSAPAVEKLPSDELCKICMDAPIECVILECGHMATCTNCGKVLNECPICRQYIIRVVRFFRA